MLIRLIKISIPDPSASRLPPTTSWRAQIPSVLAGNSQFSDDRAARPHSTSVKYGLYAGSALSRFRSSSLLSPSTSESKAPLDSSLIHPFGRSMVNWREVMGDMDPLIKVDQDSSLSDDLSTQSVDTPVHQSTVLDPGSSPLDTDSLSPHSTSLHESSFSHWTTPLVRRYSPSGFFSLNASIQPNIGPSAVSPAQNHIPSAPAPSHRYVVGTNHYAEAFPIPFVVIVQALIIRDRLKLSLLSVCLLCLLFRL
jgi:hypothetical protein